MPFLSTLNRMPTPWLLAFVAIADTCVWLMGLPFEYYCKQLLDRHHAGNSVLILILIANAVLLALMVAAMAGSAVLASRGLTWQKMRR